MQRFKFHLERVLQWQLTVCRLKENDVRLCLSAISSTDARSAELEAASVTAEHDVLNHRRLTAADLMALARFRLRMAVEQKSLTVLKTDQLRDLSRARAILATERRRLRQLEKLRDRALSAHTAAADLEAEALAAEAYASRWASNVSTLRQMDET
jgi:hypothetical protein